MRHLFLVLSLISLSFASFANTDLVNIAKKNLGVKGVLQASANEAGIPLTKCITQDVKATVDAEKSGIMSFTVSCINRKKAFAAITKIEGYFYNGTFILAKVEIDYAG